LNNAIHLIGHGSVTPLNRGLLNAHFSRNVQ
jgi:hypothetical protein